MVHQYGISLQSSSKERETFWQITQKINCGPQRPEIWTMVYILVFYNISFSWLLPLDGFQFIFFVPCLLHDSENNPYNLFFTVIKHRLSCD